MPIKYLLESTDFFLEPMALVNSDGTIDAVNRPLARELDATAGSLVGQRLENIAASSAAVIEQYLHACFDSQAVVNGSLLLRRRADIVALQARGIAHSAATTDSAAQILLQLSSEAAEGDSKDTPYRDTVIPQRWREIEESLRRQSQLLEVTLASIGDAVVVTDVHGRITFMNAIAETLTGWTTQSSRGHTLGDTLPFLNEYTREPVEGVVADVLRSGVTSGLANHTLLVAREGRQIPINHSAAPIRTPGGELFGVVLVFRDVTAERNAEREHGWLAAIVESSDDAIISKTLDGQITSWNPAAARLFGYTAKEAIGEPITLVIPPELHDQERKLLERLRAGERIEQLETVRVTRDRRRLDVSLTVSPIRDRGGRIVGASKIARDITERNRAERAAREADRRKDEFLATLSHELRNSLAPIRNSADLLCRGIDGESVTGQACDIMDRQLNQLSRLVDDLLDISRIKTGGVAIVREKLDLRVVLGTVQASLQPAFIARRQTCRFLLSEAPLYVDADRGRLMQVFMNLLTNANKYTPEGGIVQVESYREDERIVVSVRDTGRGIAEDMLDRVFDLFAQAERTQGGLGVGLTLSKRLVEAHGGQITARSEGLGKGTEFVVELPASTSPAPLASQPETPMQSAVPRRVLIVDDNVDSATSLAMLLGIMGHTTKAANSGELALALAEEFRPEVVILDIGMPQMDGYETARRLRAQPWSEATLLIALTGWEDASDQERAKQSGFDAHVVKPGDLQVLTRLIAQERVR